MINDTLVRKGDGVTQTWVLSPANTELVSVKVDGVSVAYTRPTWNTVRLQAAPALDSEVAFDFTGAVAPNAVTALESRVATLELMQGTGGDNELELEMVTLSPSSVIEETYPMDPDFPEAGTESLFIYNVNNIAPTVRKLLIHVYAEEDYAPPGTVIIRLPVGFSGVVSVANMTHFAVDLYNQAGIDSRKDPYATPVNYTVNSWVPADTFITFIYRDAPDGELTSFQRSAYIYTPETNNVTFVSGNAANASTHFQRIGTGRTKLHGVYVEGNAPSHAMTVTAYLESINTSSGGFYNIAQYTCTIQAGYRSSGFQFVSGSQPDSDGFTTLTAGRVRYVISYASAPTTPASDVQLTSGMKSGSSGQLVLVP